MLGENHLKEGGGIVCTTFNARWYGQNNRYVGAQSYVLLPFVIGKSNASTSFPPSRLERTGSVKYRTAPEVGR
jgi:hypothetical protein